ncbi:hypothetical protein Zmor_011500 [Zophobas morio]|uniref:Ubiquitin carboxyl-terminal hydrolase n=1 Tax=Zophobas morio TaxID=2755281 RepID=A0AA38IKS8_9CUCU|nr:hypothetical protein Zmor_011500 [Zophobas morio]
MSLLPLEANPDLLHLLGVPKKWSIVDVYGLDEDALAYIPKPVLALILLCPGTDQFLQHAEQQIEKLKEEGQVLDSDLFFMKQCVTNTCGTVALIHSVANNADKVGLEDGPFKKLLNDIKDLTPEEKGEKLFKSEHEAFNLLSTHQELALEGQTEVNPNDQAKNHFFALVEKAGHLYELNGSKEFPINHGSTTPESFLEDAAKVCREFIARDAEDVNFTVLALAAAEN